MQEPSVELLAAAADGDFRAFEEVYRATADYVYTIARSVTGNGSDAEEVAQDVFLKVHRKLRGFRHKSTFKTWLYRITVNTAINASKQASRHRRRTVEYDDALENEESRNTTREEIELKDGVRHFDRLLDELSPDQRACIVLREVEGLCYEEIARVLGVKLNTVRTRLKRARTKLMREYYKEANNHGM